MSDFAHITVDLKLSKFSYIKLFLASRLMSDERFDAYLHKFVSKRISLDWVQK